METKCKIPCIDCICVPVCRNKDWFEVVQECKNLSIYFYDNFSDINLKDLRSNEVKIKEIDKSYFMNKMEGSELIIGRYDER